MTRARLAARQLDWSLGALGSAVALAAYWRTLAPGLIDIRDTPAFQYMGRVLGVPHQPGYPFYLLVSHLFSYVPIGSLAYRMNLLSAVFGAVSVALLYAVLRALRCSPVVAVSAALCTAFGPLVWSQSIIAEVYSLESALVCATVLAFLSWQVSRSARTFALGALLFGLSAAHHPDQWTLAPALAAFVWWTDRSTFSRAGVMLQAAAMVLVAFAPYALIIVRTAQGAPYVLEPARSVGDLWRIYSGTGYRENLFVFPLAELVTRRIALVLGHVWSELGPAGVALALVGAASIWRTHRGIALLLGMQFAGQLAFVMNYDVPDVAVFVIPLALMAWIVAAVGAESAYRALARSSRLLARGVPAACLAMPVWSFCSHGGDANLRWRTATMRYMEGAVRQMPERSVVLAENWVADQLLLYHKLGVGLRPGQAIHGPVRATSEEVDRWLAEGRAVFAFRGGAEALRLAGFPMVPERVGLSVFESLAALKPGSAIALAVPAASSSRLDHGADSGLAAIRGTTRFGGRRLALAAMGVRSARVPAVERSATRSVSLSLPPGGPLRSALAGVAGSVDVEAGQSDARIAVEGRDIVRSSAGIAAAVWDADGQLRGVRVSSGSEGQDLAIDPTLLFRVAGPRSCTTVDADAWTDLSPLAGSGLVAVSAPNDSRVAFTLIPAEPGFEPIASLLDANRGSRYALARAAERRPEEPGAAPASSWALTAGGHPDDSWALVRLGGPVPNLVRRVVAMSTASARVCTVDALPLMERVDSQTLLLGMANDAQRFLLGPGWHRPLQELGGPSRWTREARASLSAPLANEADWLIQVVARPPPGMPAAARRIGLQLDGQACDRQDLFDGWHTYEWVIPRPAARVSAIDVLSAGVADVPGIGQAGLAIGSVFFTRLGAGATGAPRRIPRCGTG